MHARRLRHRHGIPRSPADRMRRHLAVGGALVAAGVVVLLARQGLLARDEIRLVAPAVIAWVAAVRLAFDRRPGTVVRAAAGFALAAYLVVVFEHVGGWTFAATWPVLLIAAGAASVGRALFARPRPQDGEWEEPSW